MRTGRRDNGGYSLIELIVVIAILAVVAGISISGLGLVKNARDKRVCQSIYSAAGKTRVSAMAKGEDEAYLVARWDTDGLYLDIVAANPSSPVGDINDSEKIAGKSQEVYYYTDYNDATTKTAFASGSLKLYFDRSTGSLDEDSSDGSAQSDFERIESGKYYVQIYPSTGKAEWGIIP